MQTTKHQFLKKLFTTGEVAEILGLSKQTLYNWRCARKGPDYVMMGSKPMYEESAINKFIESNRVELDNLKMTGE